MVENPEKSCVLQFHLKKTPVEIKKKSQCLVSILVVNGASKSKLYEYLRQNFTVKFRIQ